MAIADTVLNGQPWFEELNRKWTLAFYFNAGGVLNAVMILFTFIGSDLFMFAVGLLAAAWLWSQGKKREGIVLLAAGAIARVFVFVMKTAIHHRRPFLKAPPWPLPQVNTDSYPSGHATMSTVFLGLALVFFLRNKSQSARWIFTLGYCAVVLGVGISRIYLGFHWLNDVVGGYLYGLAIVLAVCVFQERE
jgi:membrane-associated phospholipid phosphatase